MQIREKKVSNLSKKWQLVIKSYKKLQNNLKIIQTKEKM